MAVDAEAQNRINRLRELTARIRGSMFGLRRENIPRDLRVNMLSLRRDIGRLFDVKDDLDRPWNWHRPGEEEPPGPALGPDDEPDVQEQMEALSNAYRAGMRLSLPNPETVPLAWSQVSMYLADYDDNLDGKLLPQIENALLQVGAFLGYEQYEMQEREFGSIYERFKGKPKPGVDLEITRIRATELREALVDYIEGRPANPALEAAQVISMLMSAASGEKSAVLIAGAIIVIKHPGSDGVPTVIAHELSPIELKAVEDNPQVRFDPALAIALFGGSAHIPVRWATGAS